MKKSPPICKKARVLPGLFISQALTSMILNLYALFSCFGKFRDPLRGAVQRPALPFQFASAQKVSQGTERIADLRLRRRKAIFDRLSPDLRKAAFTQISDLASQVFIESSDRLFTVFLRQGEEYAPQTLLSFGKRSAQLQKALSECALDAAPNSFLM